VESAINFGRDRALRGRGHIGGHMTSQTAEPTDGPTHATSAPVEDPIARPTQGIPKLFVCHGDDGGPRFHPCRRVQEALRAADIEYEKVIAGHGSPIPFLRKGARDELHDATGTRKLPTLKLSDGTVITNSRAIISWIDRQR
jgi:Glutathione S-transferase, N-terminal domain